MKPKFDESTIERLLIENKRLRSKLKNLDHDFHESENHPQRLNSKESHENISRERAILAAVIENSDGPVFSVDRNYCYTSFNSQHALVMKTIYGAEIEIGHSLLDYHTNTDDRLSAKTNIDRAFRGESLTIESAAGDDSRERLHFEISHSPIRELDSTIVGVTVYAREITERRKATEQIEHFASFPRLNPNPVLEVSAQGAVLFFNNAAATVLSEMEAADPRIFLPADFDEILRILTTNDSTEVITREMMIGKRVFLETLNAPARMNMVRIYATEITQLKRSEDALRKLNRTLNALSNSNQAMARAKNEAEYLDTVCKIIVEDCGHAMVWIGFAEDDDDKTVRPVASSGFEQGYLDTLHITWADTERGRGPTGVAIRTGKPSICRNMMADPHFAPWREAAQQRGYASSIVLPLMTNNHTFGALNIYSREPDSFTEDQVGLLAKLADEIVHGITSARMRVAKANTEEALRQSEQRLLLAQKAGHVGVFDRDFLADKLLWTDELRAIYNVPPEFEPTQKAWVAFVHPDDVARVSEIIERALHSCWQEIEIEYRIVRPDNKVRWLADRAIVRYDQSGAPTRMIGTTIDVTAGKTADNKLRISEKQFRKSAGGLIRKLALSIFIAESIVMVLLALLHPLPLWVDILIDGTTMLALVSPLLYLLVFRPLLTHIKERERAEEALRQSHDDLELRVKDRTASLAISNEKLAAEIAERKRTEEALRESEQRLNRAQEISHVGSWDLDLEKNSLSWSDETYRIFGLKSQEFGATYTAFLEAVHQDDRTAVDAAYFNSIHEGKDSYEIEHRIVRKSSGEVRTVHEKCEHIRDASGRIIRSLGMVHDITERKATEHLLTLLSKAVESAANGIAITDTKGTITWVNPAFTKLTGYSLEELAGQNPRVLKSGKHTTDFYNKLWDTIVRGNPWHGQIINRRKDGSLYTDEMTITPVRAWSGDITHYIAIKEDITPRKLAEEETLRHLRSLEFISGTATHFLKEQSTPDVYQYIAGTISELLKDGLVIVNEHDLVNDRTTFRAVGGDAKDLHSLSAILGCDPAAMNLALDPSFRKRITEGTLTKVDGRLHDLAFRSLPEQAYIDMHNNLGLGDIFAMAFSLKEDLLGTVLLLTRGQGLPANARVIETFVNQAAIALKRLHAEEERAKLLADAQRERARAESLAGEVKAERNLLDAIMENTKAELAYLDPDFNFLMANSAYAEGVGRKKEELIGRNHFALFPDPDNQEIFEKVRTTGEAIEVVAKPVEFPDQPWRGVTYWDWTLVPVKDDSGRMQGLAFSLVDVTEHLRTQEAIRKNADEYRLLIEEAADGILLTNREGEIFGANKTLCEMLLWKKDDISKSLLMETVLPEDYARLLAHRDELKAGKAIAAELQLRKKDGTLIDVEANAKQLVGGRIQIILRDITLQKQTQTRLKQVIKKEVYEKLFLKLRAFRHGQSGMMNLNRLALFAENLQTPYEIESRTASATKLLRAEAARKSEFVARFELAVTEFMDIVAPELSHIASLVMLAGMDVHREVASDFQSTGDELLSLTDDLKQKLEVIGQLSLEATPRSAERMGPSLHSVLNTITKIQQTIYDMSRAAEASFTSQVSLVVSASIERFASSTSTIDFVLRDETKSCKAIFNASELGEIVDIFIVNAIEALANRRESQGKGRVLIQTAVLEEIATITIEDNGPGVNDAIRDDIFEDGVSSKGSNRGFGLSYAIKSVMKYGGKIRLDSSYRSGARFVIELPKA